MSKRNNNIKYIGNHVVNHKVEQILRAILLGAEGDLSTTEVMQFLNIDCNKQTIQFEFRAAPHVQVPVGRGTPEGNDWTFTPSTNTALITLGINPSAVLYGLNRIVQENIIALSATNEGELIAPFGAVLAIAYTVENPQQYEELLTCYEAYKQGYKGVPKHWKQAQYKPKFNKQGA